MCLPFSVCWGECSPVHDCLVVCVRPTFRLACLYMCVCQCICASVCVCLCVYVCLVSASLWASALCICDDCVSLCVAVCVFVCLPVYQVLCMCAGVSAHVCMSHAHMTLPRSVFSFVCVCMCTCSHLLSSESDAASWPLIWGMLSPHFFLGI